MAGNGTVLLVDDDAALLAALARVLRPDGVRVLTANNGDQALETFEREHGLVDVVVSDYAMPGMTGADFLRAVRLRWPDTTRMLATGNADLPAAARAVNEGQVARLITKPCDPDEFRQMVMAGLEQYRLLADNRRLRELANEQSARLEQWNDRLEKLVDQRTAELERANASLQRGLLDTVRLLVGFLERRLPARAARCREIARLVGRLGERLGTPPETLRRIQVAALVHDIGLLGLPDHIVRQEFEQMPFAARVQYEKHAIVGQGMLNTVEPLVEIATWIRHHHERWDGIGYPDRLSGSSIPLASRLIAIADGYIDAVAREGGTAARWRSAQRAAGAYDPQLVDILAAESGDAPRQPAAAPPTGVTVSVYDMEPGQRLAEAVLSTSGAVLVNADEVLQVATIRKIQSFAYGGVLASETVSIVAPQPVV